MKIAIYSGVIPSTTFIELLIQQLAKHHTVLLFGTSQKIIKYRSNSVFVYPTPKKAWQNGWLTLKRSIGLLFKSPRLIYIAMAQSNKYNGLYTKWMRFSRYVPVLLHQPDIFHLQWANEIDRWTFLKEAYDCKLVVSCLGTHINISPKVYPKLKKKYLIHFHKVDAFQSVSESLKDELALYNIPQHKISVIKTPISASTFDLFNQKQKETTDDIKIVSVGRYHWVKGYNYALKAMSILKQKGLDFSYTIIAPGKPSEELIYAVSKLELKNVIEFKQEMEQNDLFKYLKQCDLMLLPSVSEGVANVAVEAMAIGLPIIATNCGGMAELINHGTNGWLVPNRNAEAIAESIEHFLKVPIDKRQNIISQAHADVKATHYEETIGAQFKSFYSELAKTKME